MNDNEQILVELRKISAWADSQRKIAKRSFICFCFFALVPVTIVIGVFVECRLKTKAKDHKAPEVIALSDIDWYINHGNVDKAIEVGEKFVLKSPFDTTAHWKLGSAYLTAGKLAKAREQYEEGARLWPTDENKEYVKTLDRRIWVEKSQSFTSAKPTPEAARPNVTSP